MKKQKRILAWHFLPADGCLAHRKPKEKVIAGRVYKEDRINICHYGLHASIRPINVLWYAPGPILCRVESYGEVQRQKDKLCSSSRKVLWIADASRVLHVFACEVAERALKQEEAAGRKPDKRAYDAVATKRKWLDGKATDEELSAAWSAAWSVAESAESAARSTARSAARSAAESAARSAESAARSAAWSAAWSAEKKRQNHRLGQLFRSLAPKRGRKK